MVQAELVHVSPEVLRGRLWDPRAVVPDNPPRLFVAQPGRFHLYADRAGSPAHRSALVIALAGLRDVISISHVDDPRPAATPTRHLAPVPRHRDRIPALPDAYRATDPDFSGAATTPALWDRDTYRVVSNDYPTLERDLATEFVEWSAGGIELYPADLRADIDELNRWLSPVVDHGPSRFGAVGGRAGIHARALLTEAFARLDRTLSNSRYLLGDRLTLADVRLWVTLVRFGADAGRGQRISSELTRFASLWAYAQNLYEREEFQATTHPSAFRR